MTPTELKSFCHSALTEAQAKGYRIVDDITFSKSAKCCCLIGALVLKLSLDSYGVYYPSELTRYRFELTRDLKIDFSSLTALEYGFMAVNDARRSHPDYAIGAALREEFKPTSYNE